MGRQALIIAAALVATRASGRADPVVTDPDPVVGDGRSVAPVVVPGEPVKGVKELPVPDVASVTCNGASGLAAVAGQPAVLAPVVTQQTELDCAARLRNV
ncbi:MAG: hypothetical protein H0V17_35120, partial [Deltaproteobacteria bacterium]|nr:hypothetical protein [Deltaproteobacteria bacterium]